MIVTAIPTTKVYPGKESLLSFLDHSLSSFTDRSILVITSKIVALSEGRYISRRDGWNEETVAAEADYYLPKSDSSYGVPIAIYDNALIARAGIDGSNAEAVYSLLPRDSYRTAHEVRTYLTKRFETKNIGVIITDSHSTPLRRGVTGVAIGWSGFSGIRAYANVPDIFGHHFTTHANVVDALATAAVITMGEGAEQTPLATITDIPLVEFHPDSPTPDELAFFKPALEADLFAPLMNYSHLKKGRHK